MILLDVSLWELLLCRCTNAEPYIVGKLPTVINDPAMLNNTMAIAEYYLYNQGGGVSEILKNAADVDLDDVYATVNSTRDQAIQVIHLLNPRAYCRNKVEQHEFTKVTRTYLHLFAQLSLVCVVGGLLQ